MLRPTFDLDALRSFVLGAELGSFAKASERLSRSTSAVSAQLKRLEEQAGQPLVRRLGRGLTLTDAGETLLAYGRRLLDLNDEAATALRGAALAGTIRLGLQEDFGESLLPHLLGQFARAHPNVLIEVRIARNSELLDRIATGQLDLALAWDAGATTPHAEKLGRTPMRWIGSASTAMAWSEDEPLPLVMLEAPCLMRTAATNALDRAGRRWRVAYTSTSLAGIWAAVSAGLGVTVRTGLGLPASVRPLAPGDARLPKLSALGLQLLRPASDASTQVLRLETLLRDALLDSPGVQAGKSLKM